MQNLFICKFSALKIQFFPSVSVLPSSRTPLSSHPPRHPASFLVGTRLLDLGGTRVLVHAAWYGEARGRRTDAQCRLFGSGNVASPVQSSFLGIVPVGVYSQICILKKYCHADCGRGTLVGTREHQTVAEPLLERERRLRAQDTLRRALPAQPSDGQRGKYY